jgi:Putative zinc-finger
MNCAECQEQLVPYIEQLLDDAQAEQIAEHVKDCPSCQAELEGLQTLQGRLVSNGKAAAQSDLEEEVMNRIICEQSVRLKSAAQASASLRLRRLIMKSPITKVAVAALVIVAVGIGISEIGGGTPAFAQVVRSILEARTATFRVVTSAPDQPAMTMEGKFMDPGLGRHTMQAGEVETIMIMDYVQGKGLVLVPSQNIAMAIELEDRPNELDPGKINVFKVLRDRIVAAQENPDESVEYLGESQVDGQKVIGYRMTEDGTDTTIWADVDSLLPLQIEYSMGEALGQPVTVTMMDIKFNVPLDLAEFKTTVPEGYQEMTMQVDASEPAETDLVEMLGLWVEITDGQFPADLTLEAVKEFGQAIEVKMKLPAGEKPDFNDPAFKEFMQTFQKINRSLMFVRNLPKEADWHYTGADATSGDKTTPICWYRPTGSETYRVIYADLSVLDVAPEDLPQ